MAAWKGNISNPAPNDVQETIERSEKIISDNRAEQLRRDTDKQKDFTISLYDIDETILLQLEQLQLQVEDQGKQIKVPVYYGSPERWVSAQRDGYIRDKQGKLILPAIVLKRTNSESDSTLPFFNRYLNASVMRLYSPKNQYTKFSTLVGKNAPVNEVYNITIPSHMTLTYRFIIWTSYLEQMNKLVEAIQFNTKDYWGSKKGFRFRTKVESYGHTIELQANDDRIIKTEFDLITHGYILPDQATYLERHKMTTQKMLTPKKIIMGAEVVSTNFDSSPMDKNREKWRNPKYPNLQADVNIPSPPINLLPNVVNNSGTVPEQIVGTLKSFTPTPITNPIDVGVDNNRNVLRVVPPPTTQASGGSEGYVSYDSEYFYIFSGGNWRRVAISEFTQVPACQEGAISFNNEYLYLYSSGSWRQVAINRFT